MYILSVIFIVESKVDKSCIVASSLTIADIESIVPIGMEPSLYKTSPALHSPKKPFTSILESPEFPVLFKNLKELDEKS